MSVWTSSNSQSPLTRKQTASGLRWMFATAVLWGAYTPIAQVTGPIFTGFALWLGATEPKIAVLSAVVYLAGMVQPLSFFLTNLVRNKKAFLMAAGTCEIVLMLSVVGIPEVFPPGAWVGALMVMVLLGTAAANLLLPTYNTWMSTLIPSDIRGRYLGRRTTLVYVAMIAAGYAASSLIDSFPEGQRYAGFVCVFTFGVVVGVGGYLAAGRAAFPPMDKVMPVRFVQLLRVPFADPAFGLFLLFYLTWVLGAGFALPFVSVYCLKALNLSYTTIAVFFNISMAVMIIGYQFWGHIVDAYGARNALQLLMMPRALLPLIWALVSPSNYTWLLTALMVLSGLTFSGLNIAFNALLYDLVPEDQRKPAYFASWAGGVSLVGTCTYLLSGWLVREIEGVHTVAGLELGHLQIMFLISASFLVVPNVLLLFVPEPKTSKPGHAWSVIWRGNPFAFVYNTYAFSRATSDVARAAAARRMGRSRSPMAVEPLAKALEDPSYRVRSEAAKGLGQTRQREAVEPLTRELDDEESDIRAEAAEALGQIATPDVVGPLLKAADDPDLTIRMSAIRALMEMGRDDVRDKLFEKFCGPFDRATFALLAEALSRSQDLRIVAPIMQALDMYRSPVIKLQLLECVCRALGTGNRFYELSCADDLARMDRISRLLRRAKRALSQRQWVSADARRRLKGLLDDVAECYEHERLEDLPGAVHAAASQAREHGHSPTAEASWQAIDHVSSFEQRSAERDHVLMQRAREVFPIVCLCQLLSNLGD